MTLPSIPELALGLALAWGAGVRVYAVIFLCGLAGTLGWVELPGKLTLLMHPLVLGTSGFMLMVEFFADKLPWLDSLWDMVHSFIRIPAGAVLVGMMFSDDPSAVTAAAAILGGAVAAGAHFTKAGARGAINLSPEPFSNWGASLFEDALVPGGLWLAVVHPVVFIGLLLAGSIVAVLLIGWLIRGLKSLYAKVSA